MKNHLKTKDWKETQLSEDILLISGQHILAEDYSETSDGVPYLTGPTDFNTGKIVATKFTKAPKSMCKKGDILITVKGSGTGSLIKADRAYCISRQLMAIRTQTWDSNFLYYVMSSLTESFNQISSGLIPGISRVDILNQIIVVPNVIEQKKIAEILSTWDEAIETTKKLLTAKQTRKRALMQRLLTGKQRFPQFARLAWEKLGAGNVFKNVSIKGTKNEQLLSATQDKGIIPRSMLEARVTMPSGDTNSFKLVEVGDFVISLRSFQGGLEYSYYRGLVSPAYNVLKPIKKINDEFYKFYFKSYDFIEHLATAVIGIRDGKQISYEDFCFVKIPFPSYEEQTAIAQILQTADKEIDLLKKQRDAMTEQKRGLMQRLLTGKFRVKVDAVEAKEQGV